MKTIEEALLKFLSDKTINVAVLKGGWGIGKTYFWRNLFEATRNNLDFKAYSYVSLFGANDANDLRKQIFSNFVMLDEGSVTRHFEKLKPLSAILHAVDIPFLNSSESISDLVNSKLIENFLICFDDLERKESSISAASILGLISHLKEEKHCKILLIYNDQELDNETKKDIDEYREKVVDLELTYKPTIDHNLSVIWPNGCPDRISSIFQNLKLNNIRIMQRAKWAHDYFSAYINENYPHLCSPFEYKTAALTVLYHGYSKQISLDEALSMSYFSMLKSNDDRVREKLGILKTLKFIAEDQDKIIAEYLVNGYVDFRDYEEILRIRNEQYRLNNVNDKFRELWTKYHSNFSTSQEEFVEGQVQLLKNHVEDLSIKDVAPTVDFIRELDKSQDLAAVLDRSIDLFVRQAKSIDHHSLHMMRLKPEVLQKIQDKFAENNHNYSITQLFIELAGSNGWDPGNIQYLKNVSEEDYFTWISTEKGENVISLLTTFLRRFGNANDDERAVVQRIRSALERVKERSQLDRFRVEYLIEGKNEQNVNN